MSHSPKVEDRAPRAVLYLRQSVSHDDSISLELQEAAGRDYCLRSGYTVIAVESDPGISGRTWKRPAVRRVMAMIDERQADVVVLWKWSRLSRSRLDWAVAVDRAELAGGRIESSTETVDVATATGRLARGMMAEFAAFESDRIGEGWKEVHASRLKQGRTPNGKPKYGYIWNHDSQVHQADPHTGPVLAQTYRRYIAGESIHSLVRWLNSAGHRTLSGGTWSDRALRRVMDAGFAAGLIPWRGEKHPGIHEPLIDAETWQAFLDARVRRRQAPPRRERSQYLLSGLVRCARCGGPMTAGQYGASNTPKYRCATAKGKGPEACVGGYVMAAFVEAAVMTWLKDLISEIDDAANGLRLEFPVGRDAEKRRLTREATRLDESLQRLTVQVAEALISAEDYGPARDNLTARRAVITEQLEALGDDPGGADAPLDWSLADDWCFLPARQRRELLQQLMVQVRVTTGQPRATFAIDATWSAPGLPTGPG